MPANVLRDRLADVLSPADLAKRHRAYHYRVMIGPSYRADMWAAMERNPELSTADLARKTYGSFATAWRVKREFAVLASQTVGSATIQKTRNRLDRREWEQFVCAFANGRVADVA